MCQIARSLPAHLLPSFEGAAQNPQRGQRRGYASAAGIDHGLREHWVARYAASLWPNTAGHQPVRDAHSSAVGSARSHPWPQLSSLTPLLRACFELGGEDFF